MTNLFQKEQAAAEGDNGRQLKEQMANGSLNITISQEDLCALQSMCSDIVAETWGMCGTCDPQFRIIRKVATGMLEKLRDIELSGMIEAKDQINGGGVA